MALLFADSFDHYNTGQILRKWSSVSGGTYTIGATGRNSTNGFNLAGNNELAIQLPAAIATAIMGCAVKWTSGVTSLFFRLYDASTVQLNVYKLADGSIRVTHGGGTVLGTSAPNAVPTPTAVFNYVEVKALIHPSAGTVDVRVNGASVLAITGANTRNSANSQVTQVALAEQGGSGNSPYFDDFYVCDTSGASANTFLGDVRIEYRGPTGAGSTTALTASAGSNYQCVDDNPANDDTDYVSSSTASQKDTYAMADLVSTAGAVVAVAVVSTDRKDDAGARTHSHVVNISGGTEAESAAFSPTTSYSVHQTIFHTKPGGGAWTITDVNNIEAGPKLVT
jgi:hypothetical protein